MPDQVKVIIAERNGIEVRAEELLLVPQNIPFSDVRMAAHDVQAAILESKIQGSKFRYPLTLVCSGGTHDSWLTVGDNNINSYQVPWTPPWDSKVVRVTFTNNKPGNNGNPLVAELRAYRRNFGTSGNLDTSDETGWYIQSNGAGLIQSGDYGRMWIYDNSNEGDEMLINSQYAFRVKRLSGPRDYQDVYITVWLEAK